MPGPPTPDPSHGPGGLIVIMRPDPALAARALAHEHGIEVTTGGAATTEAIARLLEHADAASSHHPADDAGDTTEPATATPAHRPTDADLDGLAAGMRRADALRDRTRQRIADELCNSLNSSLAIHPDTLRQAATELIDATHAITQARAGRSPGAKQTRAPQAGTVGAVGALGAAATAVGLAVAWPAGLAVAGVGAVSGLARQHSIRRTARRELPGLEAGEALARRRWERLAGTGADPADLDAVIRRYDPHTDVIGGLLTHHPAVRAAQRVADDRRQAWVQAWQVAVDDPLSARSLLERGDDHAASVDPRSDPADGAGGAGPIVDAPWSGTDDTSTTNAQIETSSTRDESGQRAPVPTAEPSNLRVAVVVSPYDGLTEVEAHRLHDRLLELPATIEVVVVLGNDVLDGVGEPPAASAPDADEVAHQQSRIIDLTSRSVLPWPAGAIS